MPPPWIRPLFSASLFRRHNLLTPLRISRLHLLQSVAIHKYVGIFAQFFVVFHFATHYLAYISLTEGASMMPTIPHGYRSRPAILISKLHRRGRNIAVGDVVSYDSPAHVSLRAGKRVVGMPGDLVSVITPGRGRDDGDKEHDEGDWANVKEQFVRVPEGHCWVAGDNLDWSRDSRQFGPLPLNLIQGKAVAVVWPPSAWTILGGQEGIRDVNAAGYETLLTK